MSDDDFKPSFYPAVRKFVIDRARDRDGHVICAHCTHHIRDDQQITINHRNQWQAVRGMLYRDAAFIALAPRDQRRVMQNAYNDFTNLDPLHVACHLEVDEGMTFTPEEAEFRNRKYAAPMNTVHAIDYEPPRRLKVPVNVAMNNEIYAPLLALVLLDDEQRVLMDKAPRTVKIDYLAQTRERLEALQARVEKVAKRGKTHQLDKLYGKQEALEEQIRMLESSIGSTLSRLPRARLPHHR